MRTMTLRSGTYFTMGDGSNWRVISPEVGAEQITLNFGIHAAGQEFAQHIHDRSEDVIVCLAGGTSLRHGAQYFPIRAGDAVWIEAGEVHGTKNDTDDEVMLFSFQSPPDVALYRGERDSMRGAGAPEIPPGHESTILIRSMAEAPTKADAQGGLWRSVFSRETGSRCVTLDHIRLERGGRTEMPVAGRERVLVVLDGSLRVGQTDDSLERTGVLFVGPGDERVSLAAGECGATMVCATSIT